MKKIVFTTRMKFLITCLVIPSVMNGQQLKYPAKGNYEWLQFLGNYYSMYLGNRMSFTDVSIPGPNKSFLSARYLVDFGTDTTVVDLHGLPGYVITPSNDNQYSVTIGTPNFHMPFWYTQYCNNQPCTNYQANGITESGIIGTDILSQMMVTFDYKYSRIYFITDSAKFCTAETLTENGFIAVSTKGFYKKHPKSVPNHNNNPMVPMVFSSGKDSVRALAFIDPGFDDLIQLKGDFNNYYTHSININKRYFDALNSSGLTITIDKNSYSLLSNIKGNYDTLFKCTFVNKCVFNVIGLHGECVIPYSPEQFNVFLKVNGKGGGGAGGITTFNFPAAQFGGSILMDCDQITFDPIGSVVWFRQKE